MFVENNTVVSIHYKMMNSKGEVIEETIEGFPVHYVHGAGTIMPFLENQLLGLQNGDKQLVVIAEEQGAAGGFYMEVVIENIRMATPAELRDGLYSRGEGTDCGPMGCC